MHFCIQHTAHSYSHVHSYISCTIQRVEIKFNIHLHYFPVIGALLSVCIHTRTHILSLLIHRKYINANPFSTADINKFTQSLFSSVKVCILFARTHAYMHTMCPPTRHVHAECQIVSDKLFRQKCVHNIALYMWTLNEI